MGERVGCKSCGNPAEQGGYEFPLCPPCRDLLSRRPLPGWIKGVSAVVVLVLLLAFTRFPASLKAGVAFEKGRRAEQAENYAVAVAEYQKVVDRFPGSPPALVRLGVAHYRAGDWHRALMTFEKLKGREISKSLAGEANQVMGEIISKSTQP